MPRIKVDGKSFNVPKGKRLVLAIEENGINIGHRCGGFAGCTTCRVEFSSGEPKNMTKAEYTKLVDRDLLGKVRLSCQIVCDQNMTVKPVMLLENEEAWKDTGPAPETEVTPEAEWFPIKKLEAYE